MPQAAAAPGSGTVRTRRRKPGEAANTSTVPVSPEVTDANTHRPLGVLTTAAGLPATVAVTGWIPGTKLPVVTAVEQPTVSALPAVGAAAVPEQPHTIKAASSAIIPERDLMPSL
jgi:hypothetical protein